MQTTKHFQVLGVSVLRSSEVCWKSLLLVRFVHDDVDGVISFSVYYKVESALVTLGIR